MEYFSRLMARMSKLPNFRYHPVCKEQQLTHLTFADDLMIVCKGTDASVTRVMEAIKCFTDTTGLAANSDKSSVFITGVKDNVKERLLEITGFVAGTFPIKYLGLPLSHKKWSKMQCHQLCLKITEKIRASATRHLSYAGRIPVINSVLFSLYNFWGSVFLLPQSVLKLVDKQRREFLWGSKEEGRKIALVAWHDLCWPKKQGGLNVKNCRL
ncbi:uncharacterized protein LOC132047628 [Lycium ferocissimum]|uniref:uncharacterized protein LOC132047628 n=1 Tax=Lycium ferocissimum TaxID=112874 RepID=UPI002815332B|nr:uncharacterized protein LOC132047628 [Lycium ferocissimum]